MCIPALVRRLTHDPILAGPGAAVTVWNGSGISGLAADVGAALRCAGCVVTAIGTTPHAGRAHTVVVQNTLVGGVNDAAIHVLARMLHAPVLVRPEYGAHTPIVILLGSDVPTAR
jgi:LytR cell envelope-related transcriptional attenuator